MQQGRKFNASEVARYEWDGYFASKSGIVLSDEARTAYLCIKMGWTWQQYDDQPTWLIDYLMEMLRAEARAANKAHRTT